MSPVYIKAIRLVAVYVGRPLAAMGLRALARRCRRILSERVEEDQEQQEGEREA